MSIAQKKVVNLPVYVFDTREEMGKVAAVDAANRINAIIEKRERRIWYLQLPLPRTIFWRIC